MGRHNRCWCGHRIAKHTLSLEKGKYVCIAEKCAPHKDLCDIQPKPEPTKLELWRAKCLSKVQFFTKKDAIERKQFYQKHNGSCLRVYRCPQCHYFHLTTKP